MAGLKAMIPLDGSNLSESALHLLPFLKSLGFGEVRLVSVWEHNWDDTAAGREDEVAAAGERGQAYLEAYLKERSEKAAAAGFEVETIVKVGAAAEEVLSQTVDGIDLACIATHGRTGLRRWRLGSVADKLSRETPCPDLIIGPNVSVDLDNYSVTKVVVPLDGSEMSEEALPLAAWIADKTNASIDLIRAVSLTPMAMDPSLGLYPVDLVSSVEDAAKEYLARHAGSLQAGGKRTVTASILLGAPGEQLVEYLEKDPPSLVVMATRGHSGLIRAALGSVTDQVLHGPAPVLVIRPEEERASRLVAAAKGA
jgi:nucleotide-binding universal stress UspA family protein